MGRQHQVRIGRLRCRLLEVLEEERVVVTEVLDRPRQPVDEHRRPAHDALDDRVVDHRRVQVEEDDTAREQVVVLGVGTTGQDRALPLVQGGRVRLRALRVERVQEARHQLLADRDQQVLPLPRKLQEVDGGESTQPPAHLHQRLPVLQVRGEIERPLDQFGGVMERQHRDAGNVVSHRVSQVPRERDQAAALRQAVLPLAQLRNAQERLAGVLPRWDVRWRVDEAGPRPAVGNAPFLDGRRQLAREVALDHRVQLDRIGGLADQRRERSLRVGPTAPLRRIVDEAFEPDFRDHRIACMGSVAAHATDRRSCDGPGSGRYG